jgi:phenylalanyl-tRNA synthetase alpha chain
LAQPELDRLKDELIEAIAAARDLAALEEVRVKALGKKGRVSELMQRLGGMAPEERKNFGQAVNELKASVSGALDARHQVLAGAALAEKAKAALAA